jgi:hypothetical protein
LARETRGSWRCAATAACMGTRHMRGASDEPFGLGSRVLRGTCPLLPGMASLSGVVEVGEKAHGILGRCDGFRCACSGVRLCVLSGLLYRRLVCRVVL